MGLLFDKTKQTVETYTFKINSGGIHYVQERGEIDIVFIDGKFSSVEHPFTGPASRNAWRIMAAINEEIERIEQMAIDEQ